MFSATCQTLVPSSTDTKASSTKFTSSEFPNTKATNTQHTIASTTTTKIVALQSTAIKSSTMGGDFSSQSDAKSTSTSIVGAGQATPTPVTWIPYDGGASGSANWTNCWVTAREGSGSSCSVQAMPLVSIGREIKPLMALLLLLFWNFGVLLMGV
jgi:hypothetical protein